MDQELNIELVADSRRTQWANRRYVHSPDGITFP